MHLRVNIFEDIFRVENMTQSIQEWTKYILWKTAFKKFEGTISIKSTLE